MNNTVYRMVVFAALVVVCGYLRETFFVRTQWYQAVALGKSGNPPPHFLFSFLGKFTYDQLQIFRYAGTVFFVFVFWVLSLLMVKWFFTSPANYKTVHIVFITVFGTGVFIFCLGYILPAKEQVYRLSRWVMGFAETPLSILVLFPVMWINTKQSVKER